MKLDMDVYTKYYWVNLILIQIKTNVTCTLHGAPLSL